PGLIGCSRPLIFSQAIVELPFRTVETPLGPASHLATAPAVSVPMSMVSPTPVILVVATVAVAVALSPAVGGISATLLGDWSVVTVKPVARTLSNRLPRLATPRD